MKVELADGYKHLCGLLDSMGCDKISNSEYEIKTDKLLKIIELANVKEKNIQRLEQSYESRIKKFTAEWLKAISACRLVDEQDRAKAEADFRQRMKENGYEYDEVYGWRLSGARVGD